MHFEKDYVYHIYKRGNNRQKIFFNDKNYIFFLAKIQKYIISNCELLAYCLMPNHFHFLIQANDSTVKTVEKAGIEQNMFSESIRILLSSYTQAINKQENRTGSLFTQNTKAKSLNYFPSKIDYGLICFNYIHQNPLQGGLVDKLEDWPYSSFKEYTGFTVEKLCNQDVTQELLDLNLSELYLQSYSMIDEKNLKHIWYLAVARLNTVSKDGRKYYHNRCGSGWFGYCS